MPGAVACGAGCVLKGDGAAAGCPKNPPGVGVDPNPVDVAEELPNDPLGAGAVEPKPEEDAAPKPPLGAGVAPNMEGAGAGLLPNMEGAGAGLLPNVEGAGAGLLPNVEGAGAGLLPKEKAVEGPGAATGVPPKLKVLMFLFADCFRSFDDDYHTLVVLRTIEETEEATTGARRPQALDRTTTATTESCVGCCKKKESSRAWACRQCSTNVVKGMFGRTYSPRRRRCR